MQEWLYTIPAYTGGAYYSSSASGSYTAFTAFISNSTTQDIAGGTTSVQDGNASSAMYEDSGHRYQAEYASNGAGTTDYTYGRNIAVSDSNGESMSTTFSSSHLELDSNGMVVSSVNSSYASATAYPNVMTQTAQYTTSTYANIYLTSNETCDEYDCTSSTYDVPQIVTLIGTTTSMFDDGYTETIGTDSDSYTSSTPSTYTNLTTVNYTSQVYELTTTTYAAAYLSGPENYGTGYAVMGREVMFYYDGDPDAFDTDLGMNLPSVTDNTSFEPQQYYTISPGSVTTSNGIGASYTSSSIDYNYLLQSYIPVTSTVSDFVNGGFTTAVEYLITNVPTTGSTSWYQLVSITGDTPSTSNCNAIVSPPYSYFYPATGYVVVPGPLGQTVMQTSTLFVAEVSGVNVAGNDFSTSFATVYPPYHTNFTVTIGGSVYTEGISNGQTAESAALASFQYYDYINPAGFALGPFSSYGGSVGIGRSYPNVGYRLTPDSPLVSVIGNGGWNMASNEGSFVSPNLNQITPVSYPGTSTWQDSNSISYTGSWSGLTVSLTTASNSTSTGSVVAVWTGGGDVTAVPFNVGGLASPYQRFGDGSYYSLTAPFSVYYVGYGIYSNSAGIFTVESANNTTLLADDFLSTIAYYTAGPSALGGQQVQAVGLPYIPPYIT